MCCWNPPHLSQATPIEPCVPLSCCLLGSQTVPSGTLCPPLPYSSHLTPSLPSASKAYSKKQDPMPSLKHPSSFALRICCSPLLSKMLCYQQLTFLTTSRIFVKQKGGVYPAVSSQLWKHLTHLRSPHRAHPEPDYIICATIYSISPCSSSSLKSFLTRWLQLSGSAYINLKLNPNFCLITASAILEHFLYA